MAIVNRTPDSFYDQGATFRDEPALARVEQAVAEGAAIIDIGGVKAGPGEEVTRRGGGAAHGRLRRRGAAPPPGRGDQRRHLAARGRRGGLRGGRGSAQRRVGRGRPAAGGGRRAVRRGAGVHARGRRGAADPAAPDRVRRRDGRHPAGDAWGWPSGRWRSGCRRDADHDRSRARLREEHPALAWRRRGGWARWRRRAGRCWSPCPTRTSWARRWTGRSRSGCSGTLATTAVSAWLGAQVYRVHEVAETRQVLDMVASIAGHRPPAVARRGLA